MPPQLNTMERKRQSRLQRKAKYQAKRQARKQRQPSK